MTPQWYREQGYEISANFSEAIIDKAEKEVWDAYIAPILPTADPQDETIQTILARLAYYYLCLFNNKITRKGAKTKLDENSANTENDTRKLAIERAGANNAFQQLLKLDGAQKNNNVTDILNLWLATDVLGNNFF